MPSVHVEVRGHLSRTDSQESVLTLGGSGSILLLSCCVLWASWPSSFWKIPCLCLQSLCKMPGLQMHAVLVLFVLVSCLGRPCSGLTQQALLTADPFHQPDVTVSFLMDKSLCW